MFITTIEPRTEADYKNNHAVELLENEFKKPSGQRNYGESIALLNQAMLSGQCDAIYNLAYVKEEHEKAPGGVHEVIALYRMASTLGHAPAMTALGLLGWRLSEVHPHRNLITLS